MPPDLHLAHTSDTLLFLAVVCYALAMLGYAGEFAFRHRSAGPAANASGATALRGGLADRLGAAGVAATVLGWVAHVGSVTTRGLAVHRVPWGNMYEFSSMVALIAVTAFLVLLSRQDVRYLGAFLMVPVVTYLGLAGTVLYSAPAPLVPALHSYWIKIHVVAAISASGVFMLAGVVTVLFLVKDRWERGGPPLATVLLRGLGRMVPGGRRSGAVSLGPGTAAAVELGTGGGGGIMRALPSAAVLDRTAYRIIAFAFPVWTFAIMAGAIWAKAAWGRYWGWDPKETWSFITWLAYAGYLHARATAGWRGRKAAVLSLVGFSCLMIDYYAVNVWIVGLHSYAGL